MSFHARLENALATAERARTEARELERLLAYTAKNEMSGKPISDRIYDLLRANPGMAFSPADIMEAIHARDEHIEAVRKALHRLHTRGKITRPSHAMYRISAPNLEPLEWPSR